MDTLHIPPHAPRADSSSHPLAAPVLETAATPATSRAIMAPDPLPNADATRQYLATGVPDGAAECVTVLRACGRRLAKLVRPGGEVDGYDAARTFDMTERPAPNLGALGTLLRELQAQPDCAIVRGAVADPARAHGVRRLVHPCPQTGEAPTLREQARWWLALDMDGVPLPAGLDARDLAGCGQHARLLLPHAFHTIRALVAASASHGIKPGMRLRLWFWCSRPLSGGELARWLRTALVDASVFRPAQLIYTAAPVFAPGAADSLPMRLLALDGAREAVAVPSPAALAPPPPRPAAPLPSAGAVGAGAYAASMLARETARVSGAAVNSRHYAMVAAARSLARLVDRGLLAAHDVRAALGGAAERCGKTRDEAEAVVAWALSHPSPAPLPAGVR